MSKSYVLSTNTIIIQPGSTILRVGLAVDNKPTVLLNCIARRSKDLRSKPTSTAIPRTEKHAYDQNVERMFPIIANEDQIIENFDFTDGLYKKLNAVDINSPTMPDSETQFIPFLKGFRMNGKDSFKLEWPISTGHFNPLFPTSNIIQNFEDMWCYALENYLEIPRNSFQMYSVILIIEDVFIRREVREMVTLLLENLQFARVVVQQASVCATYGVGLPTACVVDIGAQKTSIACVDEGISLPEARVALPVGFSDTLRVFHSLLQHYARDAALLDILGDIDYRTLSDIRLLYCGLFQANRLILAALNMKKDENSTNSTSSIILPISSDCSANEQHSISLPVNGILTIHLIPFFPSSISPSGGHSSLTPTYQISASDAPQPDDPFDDVYTLMNVKEKKRKMQNDQLPASAKGDESIVEAKISKIQKPTNFDSIAEAIVWSIGQAAASATTSVATGNGEITSQSSDEIGERMGGEMWRRMLGCILLVGGGSADLGGQLIERQLVGELERLWVQHQRWSSVEGGSVKVLLKPEGVADLAWEGAKLMLSADSIADLWFTAAEWKRYGSRVLRERAPFLW